MLKVEEILLCADRLLIQPLELYTYKVKQLSADTPTAADNTLETDPDKLEEVDVTEVEQDIISDTQRAIVLAKGNFANVNCNVGDTIIYNYKSALQFELMVNTAIIRQNDVIAVLNTK